MDKRMKIDNILCLLCAMRKTHLLKFHFHLKSIKAPLKHFGFILKAFDGSRSLERYFSLLFRHAHPVKIEIAQSLEHSKNHEMSFISDSFSLSGYAESNRRKSSWKE